MAKIQLTRGFIAKKAGAQLKVVVEPYDIGYYIYIYLNLELQNMTTRNTASKVENFVAAEKKKLIDFGGWEIEDLGSIYITPITPTNLKRQ